MAVTLATKPDYPVAGREVRVTPTIGTGNFWRVFVTDAPPGSKLKAELDESEATQIEVFSGDGSTEWRPVFDKPGGYVLSVLDITRANTAGGGYQDAAENNQTETVNARGDRTIYVGQFVDMALGVGTGEVATLRVFVHSNTIRATNVTTHGQATPKVLTDGLAGRALTAALDSTVVASADALVDLSAPSALGNLSTVLDNIRTKYEAHRVETATYHYATDGTNTLSNSGDSASIDGIIQRADDTIKTLRGHIRTENSSGVAGAGDWHQDGASLQLADFTNAPAILATSSLAGAINAIADAHRSYEAHRQSTVVHKAADATNTLTALPALLQVYSDYLAALADDSPTAPATVNTGVVLLVHSTGATPLT